MSIGAYFFVEEKTCDVRALSANPLVLRLSLLREKDMQIKVINEYRLNMGDREHYQMLVDQMMAFLNLSDKDSLEVENEKRGRGE